MKYEFDAERITQNLIKWTKKFVGDKPVTIGISGGKDSTIVAMLLCCAIGADKIYGVLMPNGVQKDIADSLVVVNALNIKYKIVNIYGAYQALTNAINDDSGNFAFKSASGDEVSVGDLDIYSTNTPARLRMTALYGINGAVGGLVVNTCNGDEDEVGYSTKFGDSAGDFSPLACFTVEEVLAIGKVLAEKLGLYSRFKYLIEKTPDDGMSGKSDEEKLGMSYKDIGNYRRLGTCGNADIDAKIKRMHKANLHKIEPMPKFSYHPEKYDASGEGRLVY